MSDFGSGHSFRTARYHGTLRTGAVMIMVSGVVLLALAAFLFSYAGVHETALAGGVPRRLARLYPLIVDAIVVLACVATLAFRGAERWLQAYAWLLVVVVFAASGAISAIHAAHVSLPQRPTVIAAAILPWVLLLLGFGLLLSLLRQRRADRHTSPRSDLGKRNAAVRRAVGRESADNPRPALGHVPWDAEPDTSHVALTMPHAEPDNRDPEPESSIPARSAVRSPAAAPDTSAAVPDILDAWPDGPDVRIIPARSAVRSPAAAPDTSAAVPDTLDAWPDGPDGRIIPAQPDRQGTDREPGTFDQDLRRELRDFAACLEPPEHRWLPWMRGLGMSKLVLARAGLV
jgi:Protein of unknown function (DUF2637)